MLGAVIAGFLFESVVEDHSKDLAVAASVYDDALTAGASYTTLVDSTRPSPPWSSVDRAPWSHNRWFSLQPVSVSGSREALPPPGGLGGLTGGVDPHPFEVLGRPSGADGRGTGGCVGAHGLEEG